MCSQVSANQSLLCQIAKLRQCLSSVFELTCVCPAEVGTPVKADASFSVSRALQLQLPKQLAILEEVSEYASREYSLERALDKMQVCATAFPETASNIQRSSCVFSPCPCFLLPLHPQHPSSSFSPSPCHLLPYLSSTCSKYLCMLARQMPMCLPIPEDVWGIPLPSPPPPPLLGCPSL